MYEKQNAMKDLRGVIREIRSVELREADAVAKARASGASWAEIGSAYNVTRQAAWARWSTKENENE